MSTARPIDYSKWDRIGEGESSDEDEEQERRDPPRVTKFDAPMSVTVGGEDTAEAAGRPAAAGAGAGASAGAAGALTVGPPAPPRPVRPPPPPLSSSSKVEDVAENGDELEAYSWRQGRQEAVLMVWCAPETRAKDVAVAFDQESRRLKVTAGGQVLLEGELANPVKVDEDTGTLDWELVGGSAGGGGGQGRRAVRVALQKATPRADMVHWWSRALKGDREIDTGKIEGRKHGFQQAWEEAQALFQESVRKRAEQGPVEIP